LKGYIKPINRLFFNDLYRGNRLLQDTRIALVQMRARLGQIEENLAKIKGFVKDAAAQQADIICFPEMCVQGYCRETAAGVAEETERGNIIPILQETAFAENIVIITGLAEKSEGPKPYITQIVVQPDGTVGKYRKTHLGRSELPYFTPGSEIKVFSTPKANLGLQICWDMHFPEMTTILSLKGAEIIFSPHASPAMVGDRRGIWLKYLAARAYDNSVFVAACNLVDDDGQGHRFCGGILVLDPKGNVIAEDFGGRESMQVVDLDASAINRIRKQKTSSMANSFFLRSRRPELYGELTLEQE